jgi:hypothetical protein
VACLQINDACAATFVGSCILMCPRLNATLMNCPGPDTGFENMATLDTYSNPVRVYPERSFWYFSHRIDHHAHLMGTEMYYCELNDSLDLCSSNSGPRPGNGP